jgi:hypothetical protein
LDGTHAAETVTDFATGELSGREATILLTGTEGSGEFRKIIKNRGVQQSRVLARKALRRRSLLV